MAGVKVSPVNMKKRVEIDIKSGDTVRVWQKIQEKDKTRLQSFEGVVLAHKHGGEPGATFTVRRMNDSYGVEKIFPLFSPNIDKIEILKRAKLRRSKLYHIRKKAAREIKRQMRNLQFVNISTEEEITNSSVSKENDGVDSENVDTTNNVEQQSEGKENEVVEDSLEEESAEDTRKNDASSPEKDSAVEENGEK